MPFSIISGLFANKAAKKQAKAAKQAADAQIAFMEDALNIQQRNLLPDRIMGEQAMFAIADMLGIGRPSQSMVMQELAPEGFGGYAPSAQPATNVLGLPLNQTQQPAAGFGGQVPQYYPAQYNPNQPWNAKIFRQSYRPPTAFLPAAQPQDPQPQTVGDLVRLTPSLPSGALATSPGYQYRFNEGLRAANTAAALSGMLQSGQQLKALTRFGQNEATQEFDKRLARLGSLAGIGTSATTATNNAASNFGTNAGTARATGISSAGNARASGYIALGDSISNSLNGMLKHFGN